MRRWLACCVLASAVLVGWLEAEAEPVGGLLFAAYEVPSVPPTRSDVLYPLCSSGVFPYVNQGWGGGGVAGCRADRVMVHYSGFIELPPHEVIAFLLYSDDGAWVSVGAWGFGYWRDRGCGATFASGAFIAGRHKFDEWFYENGGGTCNALYWSVDGAPWEIVPESAFTQTDVPDTTVPTSTLPETTTTTESQTSTTLEATSTVAPSSSEFPSTTDTPLLETTTAPSTLEPVPSTIETTTSTESTTTSSPSPSSSDVTTTVAEVTTTVAVDTSSVSSVVTEEQPATSVTSALVTIAPKIVTIAPNVTSTATVLRPVATTAPTMPLEPSSTTAAPIPQPDPELTADRIVEAVFNPVALAEATPTEAEAIFASVNEGTLTPTEGERIVKAVQHAPAAVRRAFEDNINIFAGNTDTYVPLGSNVPVRTRRVIIASSVLVMAPPPMKGKRK